MPRQGSAEGTRHAAPPAEGTRLAARAPGCATLRPPRSATPRAAQAPTQNRLSADSGPQLALRTSERFS